ncbi:MAG: TOBE domain-containing protein, partial [Steroidobacteraceae bacterium]
LSTPTELYERPQSPFIADFVGHSNLLEADVQNTPSGELLVCFGKSHWLRVERLLGPTNGGHVAVAVRPENVILRPFARQSAAAEQNVIPGRIVQRDFLGAHYHYVVETPGGSIRAETATRMETGEVLVELPVHACIAFGKAANGN